MATPLVTPTVLEIWYCHILHYSIVLHYEQLFSSETFHVDSSAHLLHNLHEWMCPNPLSPTPARAKPRPCSSSSEYGSGSPTLRLHSAKHLTRHSRRGSKTDPGNYRPLSLLLYFSKHLQEMFVPVKSSHVVERRDANLLISLNMVA